MTKKKKKGKIIPANRIISTTRHELRKKERERNLTMIYDQAVRMILCEGYKIDVMLIHGYDYNQYFELFTINKDLVPIKIERRG